MPLVRIKRVPSASAVRDARDTNNVLQQRYPTITPMVPEGGVGSVQFLKWDDGIGGGSGGASGKPGLIFEMCEWKNAVGKGTGRDEWVWVNGADCFARSGGGGVRGGSRGGVRLPSGGRGPSSGGGGGGGRGGYSGRGGGGAIGVFGDSIF
ncbi:hypothetical protein HDU98_004775 [Podochytrium sp. JEL0797]|nr:hypothetical protein HDU98_004775 [Podochytrium sp. JEL0797]